MKKCWRQGFSYSLGLKKNACLAYINGSDIDVFVNGKQLSNVDCATLLGVEIDSKLSFNEHIEKVCKKLASRIAILRKIRACLPLKPVSYTHLTLPTIYSV